MIATWESIYEANLCTSLSHLSKAYPTLPISGQLRKLWRVSLPSLLSLSRFHLDFRYHKPLATLGVWQDLVWRTLKTASQVALVVKNLPASEGDVRDWGFDPWVRKIPWRRKGQPTPVFLPGESHGQRNLAGYSS